MDGIPLFYMNPKGIGRLPRFNPENLNVVAMDQRFAETVDQCRVLQGQVESYRTLAIRCNNRMDEYETVLQQHTNALRDLSERPIAPKNAVTIDDEIPDKDDGTKNESNVTTSTISSKNGRSNSMPNIKVPTTLSDQLSVVGGNAMSSAKTMPSNREPPKSTYFPHMLIRHHNYASMLSENQFKPIFNDMQSSVYFKKMRYARRNTLKQNCRSLSQCYVTVRQHIGNLQVLFVKISIIPRRCMVDGVCGDSNIANLFRRKYQSLYNSVKSLDEEMIELSESIKSTIAKECDCAETVKGRSHCHDIANSDVSNAVAKLETDKISDNGLVFSNLT